MNLIVLDDDMPTSAAYLPDQWLNRMVIESAMLLSTVHHQKGTAVSNMYKPKHIKHPLITWAMSNENNYKKTFVYLQYLLQEYTYRTSAIHKTQALIDALHVCPPYTENTETPEWLPIFRRGFKVCHETAAKHGVVAAYREYARLTDAAWQSRWKYMRWTMRQVPSFMFQ